MSLKKKLNNVKERIVTFCDDHSEEIWTGISIAIWSMTAGVIIGKLQMANYDKKALEYCARNNVPLLASTGKKDMIYMVTKVGESIGHF